MEYSNSQSLVLDNSRKDLKPPLFYDPILLVVTLALVFFSIVMIYSITGVTALDKYGDDLYFVKRQILGAMLGFGLMWFFSRVSVERLKQVTPYLYFVAVGLLLLTYIPGLASEAGGAQRWINLGILKLQPVELVKICVVIFMAGFFARRENDMQSFITAIIVPMVYFAPIALILLLQPDFGSTAILTFAIVAMSFVSGIWMRHVAILIGLIVSAFSVLVVVSPYRMSRILTFLSPMQDLQGKGYQLMQSLITVSGGNWFGLGLGESMQKLYFLPAAHTDFLFAVIAEEWGFVGAVFALLLFLIILYRGVKIALRLTGDAFSFSLAVGLLVLIVGSALVNMGVVTGMLPTKGLVLPLLGYGGSSLMASLASIGILLGLAKRGRSIIK